MVCFSLFFFFFFFFFFFLLLLFFCISRVGLCLFPLPFGAIDCNLWLGTPCTFLFNVLVCRAERVHNIKTLSINAATFKGIGYTWYIFGHFYKIVSISETFCLLSCTTSPFWKSYLLKKERSCSPGEQIIYFYRRPLFRKEEKMTQLSPLKIHQFLFTNPTVFAIILLYPVEEFSVC